MSKPKSTRKRSYTAKRFAQNRQAAEDAARYREMLEESSCEAPIIVEPAAAKERGLWACIRDAFAIFWRGLQ